MPAVTYGPNPNGQFYDTATPRPVVPLQPVDLATWDDGKWADPIFSQAHPVTLNEPWPYRFNNGDSVWICSSQGRWYCGNVVGQPKVGKTRYDDGLFWCVEFAVDKTKVRKWLAPLNGDIKPDTENTHQLIVVGYWQAGHRRRQ